MSVVVSNFFRGSSPTRLESFILKTGNLISWLTLVATGITVFEVVARYIFRSPTIWANELTQLIVAVVFVYSGIYVLAQDRHIRIRFIYDRVSEHARAILDVINTLLQSIFSLGLLWGCWEVMSHSIISPAGKLVWERAGSAWNSPLPSLVKILLFLSTLLLCLENLAQLIRALRKKN